MKNGLLLKIGSQISEFIEFKSGVDFIKEKLEIDSPFTVIRRKIGSRYYDIFCDDEGLLKPDIKCCGLCKNYNEMLAGNIIIVREDDKQFDDEDYKNFMSNVKKNGREIKTGYYSSLGTLNVKFLEGQMVLIYNL